MCSYCNRTVAYIILNIDFFLIEESIQRLKKFFPGCNAEIITDVSVFISVSRLVYWDAFRAQTSPWQPICYTNIVNSVIEYILSGVQRFYYTLQQPQKRKASSVPYLEGLLHCVI